MRKQLMRFAVLVAVVGVIGTLTGCAAQSFNEAVGNKADGSLTLVVRNDNWLHVDIYVARSSSRYRVGTVTSMSVAVFHLPRRVYAPRGEIRLLADPVGTTSMFESQPVTVDQVSQIEFTVSEYLPQSRLMVR